MHDDLAYGGEGTGAHERTAAPQLTAEVLLSDSDIDDLVAFLHALTDPAAQDLNWLLPKSVPSGLPLDPLPESQPEDHRIARVVPENENEPEVRTATGAHTDDVVPQSNRNGFSLHNVADAVGIDFTHGAFVTGLYEDPAAAMGGGLCWIDYDSDGLLDLYLINSHAEDEVDYWQANGGLPTNALYRNEGGEFRDVSVESNVDLAMRGTGCVAADFNSDGQTDLFVSADGPNVLLWNQGDGSFVEGAAEAGLDAPEWNAGVVAGDLNHDGWLDLFVTSYIDLDKQIPKPMGAFPQDYYGLADRLYLNEGPPDK